MKREKLENQYIALKNKVFTEKKEAKFFSPTYLTHKFTNWFESLSDNKQLLFYHGFFVCFVLDTLSLPFVFVTNVAKQIAVSVKNNINKSRLKKLEKLEAKLGMNEVKERKISSEEETLLSTKNSTKENSTVKTERISKNNIQKNDNELVK
ncbi:MAG: hypothetical protein J6T39_02235 [Clostridia bacterium]|nr:hypothetical protein [Clostridia bacterium]